MEENVDAVKMIAASMDSRDSGNLRFLAYGKHCFVRISLVASTYLTEDIR